MKSFYMLLVMLQIAVISNAQNVNTKTMEKNKEAIRKLYEEAMNKRDLVLLQDLISPEYTGVGGVKGVPGFENAVVAVIKGFSDVQWNLQELIAEGDKVLVRWKLTGTHTGQFTSYAPTGKSVNNDGQGIYQLKDGKVISARIFTDRLNFLQQLGVLPLEFSSPAERVRFIDKFVIPQSAVKEFKERVVINRNFIKKLPGFVEDNAYEYTDEQGNLVFVTIAVWENEGVLKQAKEVVQAEYKREGFDPAALLKKLQITMDRGIYKEAK